MMKKTRTALAACIIPHYRSIQGDEIAIAASTQRLLLDALGQAPLAEPGPLPAVRVFSRQRDNSVTPAGRLRWRWQLQSEQGRQWQGEAVGGTPLALPRLPQGYHQLTLSRGQQQHRCCIIIAPQRCYEPQAIRQGEKRWGAMVQLYTLRSADNWGVGDFADLKLLVEQLAAQGGDFVGLNPLHALYPALPEHASPYSPSSRQWLNVLCIAVQQVADFQLSKPAQRWWRSKKTQQQLAAARGSDFVDYRLVSSLKMQGLRLAWQHFSLRPASERQAFLQFVEQGGKALWRQAAYDLLQGRQIAQDPQRTGWQQWPEAYQHCDNPAVDALCQQHADELAFWQWLQWLAQQQYDACWQACQQAGMTVGLYRDLAVGVAEGGADTWGNGDLYCMAASVGAPPDPLGPLGQNWGLPPLHPLVLQSQAYQPFIDLLRANMRSSGALRIDHVMALLRLWWIPKGRPGNEGAYVRYPVDDLLAILALESQRHQCMVIGEDLGTVPEEIRTMLLKAGVYSWKVLWFEQTAPERYRPPQRWARQAIASASTHDLPTLAGFWQADDLNRGAALGIYPDKAVYQSLLMQRERQKQGLLSALCQAGAVPLSVSEQGKAVSAGLRKGIHLYLAQTRSALLGLQPEDWLGMTSPVNVPGTVDEYPNWRRKLSQPLEAIFNDNAVVNLLRAVDRQRKKNRAE